MTKYLVTQQVRSDRNEADHVWKDLGMFESSNQRQAIRAAMKKADLNAGSFRAIPESSVKVHTVKTETVAVWG